jgi:hypothetical protein
MSDVTGAEKFRESRIRQIGPCWHSVIFPSLARDDDRALETIPTAIPCLIRDGSRCLASVCNKQWSTDTEESFNYSRNTNVSFRCMEVDPNRREVGPNSTRGDRPDDRMFFLHPSSPKHLPSRATWREYLFLSVPEYSV